MPKASEKARPFQCQECPKAFTKKDHLQRHAASHSGLKPFECQEAGCGRAFTRADARLKHLRSAHGIGVKAVPVPPPAPLDDEDHNVAASLLQFGVAPTSHTSPLPVAGPSSQGTAFVFPTPPLLGRQPPSGSVPVPLSAPQYAPWAVASGFGSDGDVSTQGTVKSLELWFRPSSAEVGGDGRGLMGVERATWERMLLEVRCQIVSVVRSDSVDAYLLTEATLLVWPHKLILKTSGAASLLASLRTLLRIGADQAGFDEGVWRCAYGRKTFMCPFRQIRPHSDWASETKHLDDLFGEGASYTIGPGNAEHWLLYVSSPSLPLFPPSQPVVVPRPEHTIEILMSRLDPAACSAFTPPKPDPDGLRPFATSLCARLGLDKLLPGATFDAHLPDSRVFSVGAIQRDRYATLHVAPEADWSYASFETNAELGADGNASLPELVRTLLDALRPGRLSITRLVSADGSDEPRAASLDALLGEALGTGWRRKDRLLYEFDGCQTACARFERD